MAFLSLHNVDVSFHTAAGVVRAVTNVSLDIEAGETLGLVGESGCGKSTLGKAIVRLVPIAAGQILLDDVDVANLDRQALMRMRRQVQMIFQDPYCSQNPRSTVGRSISQPMLIAGWRARDASKRVDELLQSVGLPADAKRRYPHEFSGGQRQRIGIARALALSPKLIICDEPVSALDVSVRAQVINLLEDLKAQFGVSYLFISHDLSVVEHIADRVAVMYLGSIVELGPRDQIWRHPRHPYTNALLQAAPIADPKRARLRRRAILEGELPSPLNPPNGCAFHARCPIAQDRCRVERPALREVRPGASAACHFVTQEKPGIAAALAGIEQDQA